MYSIVLKYLQLICAAVIFEKINCDQLQLNVGSDGKLLHGIISCTALCINKVSNLTLNDCCQNCSNENSAKLPSVKQISSDGKIRLLCRDQDVVNIKIEIEKGENNDVLYLIAFQENSTGILPKTYLISDSPYVEIKNLFPSKTYKFSANVFNRNTEVRHLNEIKYISTLSSEYQPKAVSNISISNYSRKNDTLVADINWNISENETVCSYHILYYETLENPFNSNFLWTDKLNDAKQLNKFRLEHLEIDSNYVVKVKGATSMQEGIETEFNFNTPDCWELPDANISVCPAPHLENLTFKLEIVSENIYNINVTWLPVKAKHQPKYYIVSAIPDYLEYHNALEHESDGYDIITIQLPGNSSHAFFHEILMKSMNFNVEVHAYSDGGITKDSTVSTVSTNIFKEFRDRHQRLSRIFITAMAAISFILVFLVLYLLMYRRYVKRRKRENSSKEIYLRELASNYNKHEIEVDRNEVGIYETLGEGAFGVVRRGKLLKHGTDVAVKMLRDDAAVDNVEEFLREITLMKAVGKHENIVSIVGHVTKEYNEMMLLTEYCSEGNLLNFLRESRQIMEYHISNDDDISSIEDVIDNNFISNKLYDHHPNTITKYFDRGDGRQNSRSQIILFVENHGYGIVPGSHSIVTDKNDTSIGKQKSKKKYILQSRDLLMFAKQIACGMEFLSDNKIVHRDLAARNVLVCGNMNVKISDFGLSRDIHKDDFYFKSSAGRLPLKWLALESMLQQKYTTQSDVWSYGILLYEIVTLGCSPYPTVPVDCLVNYLRSGNRMAKPKNCSQDFYDLMASCWRCEPDERPSFMEINRRLDNFITNTPPDQIIDLDYLERIKRQNEQEDSYLKPFSSAQN